jgi:hypothetical protein
MNRLPATVEEAARSLIPPVACIYWSCLGGDLAGRYAHLYALSQGELVCLDELVAHFAPGRAMRRRRGHLHVRYPDARPDPFHDCDEVVSLIGERLHGSAVTLRACMLHAAAGHVPLLAPPEVNHAEVAAGLLPRGSRVYAALSFENTRGRGVDFYCVLDHRLVCINELLLAVLAHRYDRDSRHAETLLVPHHPRLANRFHPGSDVVFALGEWLYGSPHALATADL